MKPRRKPQQEADSRPSQPVSKEKYKLIKRTEKELENKRNGQEIKIPTPSEGLRRENSLETWNSDELKDILAKLRAWKVISTREGKDSIWMNNKMTGTTFNKMRYLAGQCGKKFAKSAKEFEIKHSLNEKMQEMLVGRLQQIATPIQGERHNMPLPPSQQERHKEEKGEDLSQSRGKKYSEEKGSAGSSGLRAFSKPVENKTPIPGSLGGMQEIDALETWNSRKVKNFLLPLQTWEMINDGQSFWVKRKEFEEERFDTLKYLANRCGENILKEAKKFEFYEGLCNRIKSRLVEQLRQAEAMEHILNGGQLGGPLVTPQEAGPGPAVLKQEMGKNKEEEKSGREVKMPIPSEEVQQRDSLETWNSERIIKSLQFLHSFRIATDIRSGKNVLVTKEKFGEYFFEGFKKLANWCDKPISEEAGGFQFHEALYGEIRTKLVAKLTEAKAKEGSVSSNSSQPHPREGHNVVQAKESKAEMPAQEVKAERMVPAEQAQEALNQAIALGHQEREAFKKERQAFREHLIVVKEKDREVLDEVKEDREKLKRENGTLKKKYKRVAGQREENKVGQEEVKALREREEKNQREIARLQALLRKVEEGRDKARAREEVLVQENEALSSQLGVIQSELGRAREEIVDLGAENKMLGQENAGLRSMDSNYWVKNERLRRIISNEDWDIPQVPEGSGDSGQGEGPGGNHLQRLQNNQASGEGVPQR